MNMRLAAALATFLMLISLEGDIRAESHPIWDPGLDQAATGFLGAGTPPADIDGLMAMVSAWLSMDDPTLRAQITTERGGAGNGDDRYRLAQSTSISRSCITSPGNRITVARLTGRMTVTRRTELQMAPQRSKAARVAAARTHERRDLPWSVTSS